MKYFVTIDGQDYGPADIATLRAWASEGRINASTMLKDEVGSMVKASDVLPELLQPKPVETPVGGPGPGAGPRTAGAIGEPQPYVSYPRGGVYDTGEDEYKKALIFCIIGFLCCPLIFEILAVVYANKAKAKGHPAAQTILIISYVLLGLQAVVIIGYIVLVVVMGAAMMGAASTAQHGPALHTLTGLGSLALSHLGLF